MVHEIENPAADAGSGEARSGVVIAVVRTGGLAGLRRRWRVEPEPEQVPTWIGLVERCPWNRPTPTDAPVGADRFTWSIHARLPDEQREQVLTDADLHGAWRDLVDAVRRADATWSGRDAAPG